MTAFESNVQFPSRSFHPGDYVVINGVNLQKIPDDIVLTVGYRRGDSLNVPTTGHLWFKLVDKSYSHLRFELGASDAIENMQYSYRPEYIAQPIQPPRTILYDIWELPSV